MRNDDLQDLYTTNLCIVLDQNDELKIVKSRFGNLDYLHPETAFDLISKILSNTIFKVGENNIVNLFAEPIHKEVLNMCREIYKKYEVKDGTIKER